MNGDRGAFAGPGADVAGEAGAVSDALEAEAGAEAERFFGLEALAVVADAEPGRLPVEADVAVVGARMSETVVETFPDDAVLLRCAHESLDIG